MAIKGEKNVTFYAQILFWRWLLNYGRCKGPIWSPLLSFCVFLVRTGFGWVTTLILSCIEDGGVLVCLTDLSRKRTLELEQKIGFKTPWFKYLQINNFLNSKRYCCLSWQTPKFFKKWNTSKQRPNLFDLYYLEWRKIKWIHTNGSGIRIVVQILQKNSGCQHSKLVHSCQNQIRLNSCIIK